MQYELNGLQVLMYVLFIPIVWFTFQYNFMHYAQFFQDLCWALTLSVSLCPTHYAKYHCIKYRVFLLSFFRWIICDNTIRTDGFAITFYKLIYCADFPPVDSLLHSCWLFFLKIWNYEILINKSFCLWFFILMIKISKIWI